MEKHLAKTNIPYYLIKTFHLTPYKLSHKMNALEIKKHQKASLFLCYKQLNLIVVDLITLKMNRS